MNLLEWDSEFLGIRVASHAMQSMDHETYSSLKNEMDKQGIVLCYLESGYLLSKMDLISFNISTHSEIILFTKTRLTFKKELKHKIAVFQKEEIISERFYKIVFEAGHKSRFKKDSKFVKNEFERLYRLWIERSVERIIADEVLVVKINGDVVGMVTFNISNEILTIGLIGVDPDFRGQNIGASLMFAVENYAIEHKVSKINVSTQGDNYGAINFYNKNQYSIESTKFIYHLWN